MHAQRIRMAIAMAMAFGLGTGRLGAAQTNRVAHLPSRLVATSLIVSM